MLMPDGVLPTPVRFAVAVPPGVPVLDRVAVFEPGVSGLNLTITLQLLPLFGISATAPQFCETIANEAASVPPRAGAVRAPVGTSPVFVRVNVVFGLLPPGAVTVPKS